MVLNIGNGSLLGIGIWNLTLGSPFRFRFAVLFFTMAGTVGFVGFLNPVVVAGEGDRCGPLPGRNVDQACGAIQLPPPP